MIHRDRDEFLKILERTSAQSGFSLRLLEKDYYLTMLLGSIHRLSDLLVFKGGTCLNKVYFHYHRLSEDLDFTLILPAEKPTRSVRREAMKSIKESIVSFASTLDMVVENPDRAGHRESTQYIFILKYDSVVLQVRESIKLEISLRNNPLRAGVMREVRHLFSHPFTGEPLFNAGAVLCLSIQELVAEKVRAAATRPSIAPRDFYDLWFVLNSGFDFQNEEFRDLVRKKLEEDGFSSDPEKFRINMGRTQDEIDGMTSRIEHELLPVLSAANRQKFSIEGILSVCQQVFV